MKLWYDTIHCVNRVYIVVWLLDQNFGIGLITLALTKDSTSLVKTLTSTFWPLPGGPNTGLGSTSRSHLWPRTQGEG